MKTENKLAQILDEVLCIAAERGLEATQSEGLFEQGEAIAYADIISQAISTAKVVGYNLNDLGLDGKNISEIEKSLLNPAKPSSYRKFKEVLVEPTVKLTSYQKFKGVLVEPTERLTSLK